MWLLLWFVGAGGMELVVAWKARERREVGVVGSGGALGGPTRPWRRSGGPVAARFLLGAREARCRHACVRGVWARAREDAYKFANGGCWCRAALWLRLDVAKVVVVVVLECTLQFGIGCGCRRRRRVFCRGGRDGWQLNARVGCGVLIPFSWRCRRVSSRALCCGDRRRC